MRFPTTLAPFSLLLASSIAAPTLKRDTNSDAVSSLESASTKLATSLNEATTALQALYSASEFANGGIVDTTIQNLINNFVEGVQLFENIAGLPTTSDASTMAQSMTTEMDSLQSDMNDAKTALSPLSSRSVNDINEALGDVAPPVSSAFNKVVDGDEALGLPSLPRSVNDINEALGEVVPPISDAFNKVVDGDEALGLPSLPRSVNDIDNTLGDVVPGVSDVFNEVADTVEGLGLPSLPRSVNGIDELLGTLIPGVSDVFNEVADTIEALGLPSLP